MAPSRKPLIHDIGEENSMSDEKPKRVPAELTAERKEEIREIVDRNKPLFRRLS